MPRQLKHSRFASLEAECAAAIAAPGALIRIKGAWQTGKTSFIQRLVAQAQQLGYATALGDLTAVIAKESASDLDKFLYGFCQQVTHRLALPDQLDDYWDDLFGSAIGCKSYFEEYLLPTLQRPLLLVLDDIDSLFPYPPLADEFFGLLRAWHEEAKTRELWQQLRLVVAHSAEVYIPLNLNKSPFNVGIPVELGPLSPPAIVHLAQVYGLDLSLSEALALIDGVGGWPRLVQVALQAMAADRLSVAELTAAIATHPGPFGDMLRHLAEILAIDPPLMAALEKVFSCDGPVELATAQALKLQSLGLVRLDGKAVRPSCVLYRDHLLGFL